MIDKSSFFCRYCRVCLFLTIELVSLLPAATYHIAADGDDSRTTVQVQNPETPWQSLTKISTTAFLPGDSILFRRGDVWEGTLTISSSGTSGNLLVYGAYGSGKNPEIKGTMKLSGPWTPSGSGLFQSTVSAKIYQVLLNGNPMTLARFPNSGYLPIKDTVDATTIHCDSLGTTDWTSAMMHVRTANWTIASKKITGCNTAAKSLTVNAVPEYGFAAGWGFFINNALTALDTAGEWFYDSTSNKLYVALPSNQTPADVTLEGTVYTNAITAKNKTYVQISDFTLTGHRGSAISLEAASGCVLSRNIIHYPESYGIRIFGSSGNNRVDSNTVTGANLYGISMNSGNSYVRNNFIHRVALLSNLTAMGLGDQCCSGKAVELNGSAILVSGNRIDSIGYTGIRSLDASCVIEYNYVTNCCLTKDDGAGIYVGWQATTTETGSAGTIIRKNVVLHTRSAPQGTPTPSYKPGEGIYVDDRGHDITIEENTSAFNSRCGIFLHNNKHVIVRSNLCYNNPLQLQFSEDAIVGPGYTGYNRATRNVLYSCTDQQFCFRTGSIYTDTNLGFMDSNYYYNPYADYLFQYNSSNYTLSDWQILKNMDGHSRGSFTRLPAYRVLDTVGSNLISNGAFSTNINGWSRWPNAETISLDSGHGMDDHCLRIYYMNDSSSSVGRVYPSGFALSAGQTYLLSFSALSNNAGAGLSVTPIQSHSPYGQMGKSNAFLLTNQRREFTGLLNANSTDAQCRIDFINNRKDSLYWLDNVSLLPVSVEMLDPLQQSVLFYNPTMNDSLIGLGNRHYRNIDGTPVSGSLVLNTFGSTVLIVDTENQTGIDAEQPETPPEPFSVSASAVSNAFQVNLRVNRSGRYSVEVFDINGRFLSKLIDKELQIGQYHLKEQRKVYAQGMVFIRVRSDILMKVRKLCLFR